MWTVTWKRIKLQHCLIPYTKINPKWIKYLNLRPDFIKPLEKNIGRTLFDISYSKIILNPLPRFMKIKTNGTYSNLKAFAKQMKPYIKQKYNPQNGRKYLKTKQLTKY